MEIKGSSFTLRKLRRTDAQSIQKHADNLNVVAYLLDRFPSPYTLKDAEDFINLKIGNDPVTSFVIAINDEAVGMIGLEPRHDVFRQAPMIGYWLGEEFWGRGIVTEAVKLVTAYAFEQLNISCILVSLFGKNTASIKVLEKAGYVRQAVLKQTLIKRGEVMDEHIYAIYK